jgi:hypothetical protein
MVLRSVTTMPGDLHFKTVYKDELIKITGSNPIYTVEWSDGKTMIIEKFADGWYMHKIKRYKK